MSLDKTNEGRRVELVFCFDQDTYLRPGARGTYQWRNETSIATQHSIKWDDGSSLMLLDGIDAFKFVEGGRARGGA